MQKNLCGCLIVAVLTTLALDFASPQLLWAQANLENPAQGSFQSGIGLVSGWKCTANTITVSFDGGPQIQAAYGTSREDTRSVCGKANNGFGLLFNWDLLGCGPHTVRALADGVEFASATFTVTTLGTEFLRGASGRFTLQNFPQAGKNVTVRWQESMQNFVLEGGSPSPGGTSGGSRRVLENPGLGSFQSGIGVISGWACDAQRIEIDINGTRLQAAYGTSREDTRSVCGKANNGFGLLFNWNLCGDGSCTVRAFADEVEFANVTVTVKTFGTEFLRGVQRCFTLTDFLREGFNAELCWQESLQNFVITRVSLNLSGSVLNNPTERQPVTGATVMTPDGQQAVVNANGSFAPFIFPFCPNQLTVRFANSSQNIYRIAASDLSVSGAKSALRAESDAPVAGAATAGDFFAEPVAANSRTQGVTITPTLTAPGGTATITDPQDGVAVSCRPPPEVCRFRVQGTASPVLGQPGTRFNLSVSVTPIFPPGGGTFPQFPPVSVDPVTGNWVASAQIGSEVFQAQPGDIFEILAFVTDATLTRGTVENPLRFPRPVDVPGVVHISRFVRLTVGQRMGGR